MQNTLLSPRERAIEKMATKEVNFSWELVQPRLRQWLYEKGHQDFFIILIEHKRVPKFPSQTFFDIPVCQVITC